MEQRTRELIGRAAMLIAAIALLAASAGILRVGYRVGVDEAAQREALRRANRTGKTTGYTLCFVVGGAAIGLAGLYLLKLALLSHRKLDLHPPKPPVLWENPEPGARQWRGPS